MDSLPELIQQLREICGTDLVHSGNDAKSAIDWQRPGGDAEPVPPGKKNAREFKQARLHALATHGHAEPGILKGLRIDLARGTDQAKDEQMVRPKPKPMMKPKLKMKPRMKMKMTPKGIGGQAGKHLGKAAGAAVGARYGGGLGAKIGGMIGKHLGKKAGQKAGIKAGMSWKKYTRKKLNMKTVGSMSQRHPGKKFVST